MKKNVKITILSIFIIITTFIIIRRSTILYLEFKNISLPNKESRQIGDMSTHKWVTVKKISCIYIGLGYWFGDSWESIVPIVTQFGEFLTYITILIIVLYFFIKLVRNKKRKANN